MRDIKNVILNSIELYTFLTKKKKKKQHLIIPFHLSIEKKGTGRMQVWIGLGYNFLFCFEGGNLAGSC